jgi:hypothetical protein
MEFVENCKVSTGASDTDMLTEKLALGERIIQAVSSIEARTVLKCVVQNEKSALQIAAETGIPLSSVYRKIVELKEAGVIVIDNYELDGLGRKEAKYVSTVEEITLCINAGAAEVRMIPSKKATSRKTFVFTP